MLRYIHETCDHAWDLALDAAAMGHTSDVCVMEDGLQEQHGLTVCCLVHETGQQNCLPLHPVSSMQLHHDQGQTLSPHSSSLSALSFTPCLFLIYWYWDFWGFNPPLHRIVPC